MKTQGTYFQNSKETPIVFGEVEIYNNSSKRLRGELLAKFPAGLNRLPFPLPVFLAHQVNKKNNIIFFH